MRVGTWKSTILPPAPAVVFAGDDDDDEPDDDEAPFIHGGRESRPTCRRCQASGVEAEGAHRYEGAYGLEEVVVLRAAVRGSDHARLGPGGAVGGAAAREEEGDLGGV
eukprot:CAMPEP_0197568912 /NCGR_PEP_ID=MMETSP1320-20131121/38103_1 /TAXON_ID=91990 /ORGANISM="Bolidomonas sp., Strain RCC2347" /LENGTH=107 /DNA_ID=CAMNT_0043131215 /DNA_START=39 /DNA_END=364 /DNA_ORIENTATION=+